MSFSRQDFDEACRVFVLAAEKCGFEGLGWEDVKVQRRTEYDETILRITRSLTSDDTNSEVDTEGEMSEEQEDGDDEGELLRNRSTVAPLVIYDVVHSTSYQVPVLYVTFQHLLEPGLPSLDQVYELLVPREVRPQLQAVGVMGSLSFADHPLTGLPAYFVHPCRTAEAMGAVVGDRKVGPEEYLLAWFGMVGASVGLRVSARFAQQISASSD